MVQVIRVLDGRKGKHAFYIFYVNYNYRYVYMYVF